MELERVHSGGHRLKSDKKDEAKLTPIISESVPKASRPSRFHTWVYYKTEGTLKMAGEDQVGSHLTYDIVGVCPGVVRGRKQLLLFDVLWQLQAGQQGDLVDKRRTQEIRTGTCRMITSWIKGRVHPIYEANFFVSVFRISCSLHAGVKTSVTLT